MNSAFKLTFGLMLACGTASIPAPAAAQTVGTSLTRAERESLAAVQAAFNAGDYAGATAALTAARAAVTSADAGHYLAQFQYQIGVRTNNQALQVEGLNGMVAAGRLPPADMAAIQGQLGAIYFNQLRDYQRAERAFARQAELAPGNPEGFGSLAKVQRDLKRPQDALASLSRGIGAYKATGRAAPENWYKMALDLAFATKNAPQAAVLGRELVAAYPNPVNWRDALLTYRDVQRLDQESAVEFWRLRRVTKSLHGERDYYEAANALDAAGLAGEARAVLQEGVSARMVDATKGTAKDLMTRLTTRGAAARAGLAALQTRAAADAAGATSLQAADLLFGQGDPAKAIPLYRAALQKSGADANLVNMRLGIALALAGQRAEAETALRAVSGTRADLAQFWLAWLARQV